MKHYAFTVTRHSDDFTKIEDISFLSYRYFWDIIESMSLIIIYKVEHEGGNNLHCNHKHYHGVIYGNINYVELTDKTKSLYSVKFEELTNPERWFNYCLHELNEKIEDLQDKKNTLKGSMILDYIMDHKIERVERPKPQKIEKLLTIEIIGSI